MDAKITVVGGSNIDICTKSRDSLVDYDSNIGEIEFAIGGVGRNIAEDLSLFGADVSLLTAIGDDSFGSVITDNAREQGITLIAKPIEGAKTGVYVSINDSDGSFVVGINDMGIASCLTPQVVEQNINALLFSDYVIFDTNLTEETIQSICAHDFCLIADCVSTMKCRKLSNVLDRLWLVKTNLAEARMLTGLEDAAADDCIRELVQKGLEQGIVTLGRNGAKSFIREKDRIRIFYVSNLPGTMPEKNTSGCGDALLAGFMMGIIRGKNMQDCLVMGQAAAYLNSQSFASVNRNMSFSDLKETAALFRSRAEIKEEVVSL